MKNRSPTDNMIIQSDNRSTTKNLETCNTNTTIIEVMSPNSFAPPAREENFLYRHKKFDLVENTLMESDEIRSSKSETFSNDEEFSGIDIPVEGAQQVQSIIVNNEEEEEKLNGLAASNPSPSNDDIEENETNDKGWILDIDNSRGMCRSRAAASPEFKTFPDPVRIDFDYASTLPRLNTVANFEDKSVVTPRPRQETTVPALPSSDYETDLESSSVKLQDSKTDKDVLPAPGAPYYFSTIKANFRDKKLVSYIPRPTLRDSSGEFKVEPVRKNVQHEEERKNELKRLKQEELKICNTNLG